MLGRIKDKISRLLISEYLIVAGSGFLESALKDTKPCLRLLRKSEEYIWRLSKGL